MVEMKVILGHPNVTRWVDATLTIKKTISLRLADLEAALETETAFRAKYISETIEETDWRATHHIPYLEFATKEDYTTFMLMWSA